ncbi:MAG: PDZ domain-containing protein [Deltaproteobacteria bacterium]|nr:PDZ domain-containing protein [Deltaproteobacteria bacterium]
MHRPLKKFAFFLLLLSVAALSSPPIQTEHSNDFKGLKVFERAINFVKSNYVNPRDIDPRKMLQGSLRELAKTINPLVFQLSQRKLRLSLGSEMKELPLPQELDISTLPSILKEVLGFLSSHSLSEEEEKKNWEHLVIQGALDTLDPHSSFLPPKTFNEFRIGTKGNFGGLGIVVGIRNGELTVIAPLEGTPAWKAGIKPKDKIVQIDEESTINMPLSEAVEKLRGKIGTRVTLIVQREGGGENLSFLLTRALIKIQSVNASLIDKNRRIGLLKIKNFQEETLSELERYLNLLKQQVGAQGLAGLVLDLRNNPGGLLDQAVFITDRFLSKGVIVSTVGAGERNEDREYAKPGNPEENIPLVVLVNEGSASASEIIAGALKNLDRATILGAQTFGKGTVQTIYDLKDGSAMKLTIAKYLTPGNIPVQSIGISPDIALDPARVSEKNTDLVENEARREKDLKEDSPTETAHPIMQPILRIRYLDKDKKEEGPEEDDEGAGQVNLEEDLPVAVAKEILVASASLSRQDQIKAALPLLHRIREKEEKKIGEGLAKIGIDWSVGDLAREKPAADLQMEIINDKGEVQTELIPGKEFKIRVTVTNKGRSPYYQLMAVMHSEDPFFKNHEFVFGKIDPQEKKSWSLPIKVPDFLLPREIPVLLAFQEAKNNSPKNFSAKIRVASPPPPLYSFAYELPGEKKIEKGKKMTLLVTVKNRGSGSSEHPLVSLRNPEGEGIFIEKGRVELTPLLPGQEQKVPLQFHIEPSFQKSSFALELEIADSKTGQGFSKKLKFPIGSPLPANTTTFYIPPVFIMDYLPLDAKEPKMNITGVVSDDERPKSLILFVGEDKVYYKENESRTDHTLKFDTRISPKKGLNFLTLTAQDDNDLTSRKQWILWKK